MRYRQPQARRSLHPRQGQYASIYARNRRRKRRKVLAIIVIVALVLIGLGIFITQSHPATENAAPADTEANTTSEITVSFAGDCTLGTDENFSYDTSFNARYESENDPSYFMKNVKSIFDNDDLSVANMEGTLTTATTRADKTYAFKGKDEYAQVLSQGGIEVVDMANNHSRDYGEESYTDTIEALDKEGIASFGYDRINYQDLKGVKLALIGVNALDTGEASKDEMVSLINEAKENQAQIIIVYFHWGIERDTVPNSTQISLGHAAVDAGANLVIGSHPHVIQGYEKYKDTYIVYSLGNFCFGGNPNPSDKDCMIFQKTFTVTDGQVVNDDKVNVIPCMISSVSSSNNYQPTPADGDDKDRIEAKIKESNAGISEATAS
ncbi:MAG: CapA family protein [Eggerthellaceae bacterium]|jgi:poly-gamma-glutamate capsule biosynthesis protein CapA/YwtB (metallophosphatase superfamily)